jgi:hypothetical protein
MQMKHKSNLTNAFLIGILLMTMGCAPLSKRANSPSDNPASSIPSARPVPEGCTPGWTITSYWVNEERFYTGRKVPAYDDLGNLIGNFREDFLEQVRIDAMGRGDGQSNPGKILNYNFDNARTYTSMDIPIDFFGKPMVAFETVAANPPLPENTKVIVQGLESGLEPGDTAQKLLSTTFYARDTMGVNGKWIDIFVGYQDAPVDSDGNYDSNLVFKFENATVCLYYPK